MIRRVSAENPDADIDPQLVENIEKLKVKYPDSKRERLIEKAKN